MLIGTLALSFAAQGKFSAVRKIDYPARWGLALLAALLLSYPGNDVLAFGLAILLLMLIGLGLRRMRGPLWQGTRGPTPRSGRPVEQSGAPCLYRAKHVERRGPHDQCRTDRAGAGSCATRRSGPSRAHRSGRLRRDGATDIVTQVARMRGIVISAIADTRAERAHDAVRIAGRAADSAATADNVAALARLAEAGRTAIVPDGSMVATSDHVDVVIDATGKPAVGAELGLQAMEHGKHLVMMNVEADVTIGPWLKQAADRLGVVYSLGAGDEPSSCMELIEFVSAMGHDIVAAGKGKNNPLNHDATPDQYEEEARRRNMNPRMLVEFVDGSKTMVEMAGDRQCHRPRARQAGHARAGLFAR